MMRLQMIRKLTLPMKVQRNKTPGSRKDRNDEGKCEKETIYANIIMLAVFFFAFLGTEYLFDNCMMYVTDASGVVRAQNQMLGVSAIGFLLYNWISGFLADKSPWVTGGTGLLAFGVGAGCMGCIILHAGYVQMMIAGGVLFFLLGVLGAGVHYRMAYSVYDRAMLARCVGFAYAGGIFLQFLNNNMIHEITPRQLHCVQGLGICCLCFALRAGREVFRVWSRRVDIPLPDNHRRLSDRRTYNILFTSGLC